MNLKSVIDYLSGKKEREAQAQMDAAFDGMMTALQRHAKKTKRIAKDQQKTNGNGYYAEGD